MGDADNKGGSHYKLDNAVSESGVTGHSASAGMDRTSVAEEDRKDGLLYCPKCGTVVTPGQLFCGKCGYSLSSQDTQREISTPKKTILIAKIIAAAAVVILACIFVPRIVSSLTVSPEELMSQGDFEGAYGRASGDEEKTDVLVVNKIATFCPDIIDAMKDEDSFSLRDAWFDPAASKIVLEVSGNNSYGGKVSNYYYYTVGSDTNDYSLYASLSDLEDEEMSSFDDASEMLEKILYNGARENVRNIIANDDFKLPRSYTECINSLFEQDLIFDVEPLEETASLVSSADSTDSEAA